MVPEMREIWRLCRSLSPFSILFIGISSLEWRAADIFLLLPRKPKRSQISTAFVSDYALHSLREKRNRGFNCPLIPPSDSLLLSPTQISSDSKKEKESSALEISRDFSYFFSLSFRFRGARCRGELWAVIKF